jgi:predicted permease
VLGWVLGPADDEPGTPPVVVVNHTYWRNALGADPSIVGRQIRLLGMPFTVVGVVESRFGGLSRHTRPAFWAPLALAVEGRVWRPEPTPDLRIAVIGRLDEDTTVAAAEAELSSLTAEVVAARPPDRQLEQVRVAMDPADGGSVTGGAVTFYAIVSALVALVLVLACANVANLLLAGALSRRQEVGVRLALGASRARLVRQLLTESLVLGLAGGVGGLLLASWLMPLLGASVGLPASFDTRPDLNVFIFVVAVTLVASLLAGLAPARFGVRGDLSVHLKGAPLAAGLRTGRVRSLLVGVQAAGSIVLLVLAALLTRAFVDVSGTDLGFDVDRLAAVSPRFGAASYDAPRAAAYWDDVVARVGSMPGVDRVALADYPPFNQRVGGRNFPFAIDGHEHSLYWHRVSEGYFETLGIPLVRGRGFTAGEVVAGAGVAVISERLAQIAWQGEDPLGDTLERVSTPELSGDDGADIRIVGIAADAVVNRLEERDAPSVYLPLSPADANLGKLVVRATGDAADITATVLEAVRAIDPRVLPTAMPLTVGLQNALVELRTVASGGALLGAIALALAVTGVFGLTAVAVEQRTGEIGVRVAMGAQARDVVRLMLRDSLLPVVAGSALGLLIALAGSRVLTSFLYGISEHDPLAVASAVLILIGAAVLASLLPARRAARVDPATVLRDI